MKNIQNSQKIDLAKGVYIPAITPFDEKEQLSLEMIKHNISLWKDTDVAGYMCLGSNGEFRMLDEEESWKVLCTYSEFHGNKQVIAGVGRESLYHTKKLIDKIQRAELNFNALAVLTPSYFRSAMNDTALIEYYREVADFSQYPILLYCAPKFANDVSISVNVLRELASHPNIIGIKDTSSDKMHTYMEEVGEKDDFCVIAGTISNLHECLQYGGSRAVLSSANYFPDECARLLRIWDKDDQEKFLMEFSALKNSVSKTGGVQGVSSIKYVMNLMGYQAGIPRRPLRPVAEEQADTIKSALEKQIDIMD